MINDITELYRGSFVGNSGSFTVSIKQKGYTINLIDDWVCVNSTVTSVNINRWAESNGTLRAAATRGIRQINNIIYFAQNTDTHSKKTRIKLYVEEDPDVFVYVNLRQEASPIPKTECNTPDYSMNNGCEWKYVSFYNNSSMINPATSSDSWLKVIHVDGMSLGRLGNGRIDTYLIGTDSHWICADTEYVGFERSAKVCVTSDVADTKVLTVNQKLAIINEDPCVFVSEIEGVNGQSFPYENLIPLSTSAQQINFSVQHTMYNTHSGEGDIDATVIDITGKGIDWITVTETQVDTYRINVEANNSPRAAKRYAVVRIYDNDYDVFNDILITQNAE